MQSSANRLDPSTLLQTLATMERTMLAVQPIGLGARDEKLASVRVGSRIGARQETRPIVLVDKVLVLEGGSIDALPPGAIVVQKVSALDHESFDHAVKDAVFVSRRLLVLEKLARAELPKVFGCFGTLRKGMSPRLPRVPVVSITRTSRTKSSILMRPNGAALSPSPRATSKNTTALPRSMASITAGSGAMFAAAAWNEPYPTDQWTNMVQSKSRGRWQLSRQK